MHGYGWILIDLDGFGSIWMALDRFGWILSTSTEHIMDNLCRLGSCIRNKKEYARYWGPHVESWISNSMANDTRWNSQLTMISAFNKALGKDPYIQDYLSASKVHGTLYNRDLKMLEELILGLQPFQEATDEWQRDSQSVCTVIPAFLHMKNMLSEFISPGSNVSICKEFWKVLKESLDRRLKYVLNDTYYLLGNYNSTFNVVNVSLSSFCFNRSSFRSKIQAKLASKFWLRFDSCNLSVEERSFETTPKHSKYCEPC